MATLSWVENRYNMFFGCSGILLHSRAAAARACATRAETGPGLLNRAVPAGQDTL